MPPIDPKIDHEAIQVACRARLLTLSVVSTGAITMGSTPNGGVDGRPAYTRPAGDFIADGFRVGMEVKGAGFPDAAGNGYSTIVAVSAQLMTTTGLLVNNAPAAGRTLSVGVPSRVSWENVIFDPTTNVKSPYFAEEYLPGSGQRMSLGPKGWMKVEPFYRVNMYLPQGVGITDAWYTNALMALFAPETPIPLANGDIVRVRSDVIPSPSQRLNLTTPWSVTPFSIPLRLYTQNFL